MAPKELSELTVFNRMKAHLLGQITRIRNSLENVDSPLNQVEIRTKLASLSEVKAKIDKLRTESYRVLSDEELMDFETSLDTMEVDADNLEVSLNTLLESSNVDTSELSVKNDFANYNVKLPSINLPEFSGQYIDWLQFKSQFVSLIHDNACLSDSQKLYYLQSALKGHAKQLQTVNDSYSSLFEALEGRYENKRLIVNSHIAELLNPNKIKFESAFHLRSLIDSIQSHLRALKQLELEPNALCESMLIFVITQRLDDESRKQYEMELHSNDLPKWDNFLDFLIKRSQALENVQRNSSLKNKNEYSPKFRSFVVKSNEKTCPLCPLETHPIFKCKMFHEMSVQERSNKVDRNLTKFWDLEATGIKAESSCDPDDQAIQHFKSSVRFNSGRYEVGFPWKSHTQELNDNFSVAEKRVKPLTRRFIRDPTLYIQYSEILKEYESQGIIERVLETEKPTDRAVFYLPHQAVFRQESLTTKMRIVFHASSHEDGQPSLNDCIWSGENLNPNIFHLIISFRLNTIAITADIERAFLQISLRDEDRDAVRFLFPDIRSNQTDPYKFQVYRFKRVMFGVNQQLKCLTLVYVDDVISGADDISQALKVSKDAETIMKNASMKLRKWNSNDQTLMRTWEKEGLETHPRHPDDSSKIPSSKVLGIPWDVVHDYFTIDVKGLLQLDTSKPITKRIVLQSAGKIYDPVGMVTMVVELPFLSELKIPRKILDSNGDSSEVQIHTFSDASQKAYGAATFLRVKHKDRVSVDLVTSKSRVAPLKRLSLPRLELMFALLAARLAKEVKKILDQKCSTRAFFWTDSQVTLHWIKGPSHRWKPFVANRVREIQSLTDPNSWFHCSGKDNPADLLTRGISVEALTTNSKWWNGSSFLRQIDFQTKGLDEAIPERVYLTEMRKNSNSKEDISLTLTVTKNNFLENIIDISNNYVKINSCCKFSLQIHTQLQNQNDKDKGTPYFTGDKSC
ncbi:integrase catalytic domain-containing protein [Trichonephila clavipes]|nr:integrase catalytic domain-containing protein [Trichonephila clavipes]